MAYVFKIDRWKCAILTASCEKYIEYQIPHEALTIYRRHRSFLMKKAYPKYLVGDYHMVDTFLSFLTLFVLFHSTFSLSIILAVSHSLLAPERSCLFAKNSSSEHLLLFFGLDQTQQLKAFLQKYVAVPIEVFHCSHCDRLSLYIFELVIFVRRRCMTQSGIRPVLSTFFTYPFCDSSRKPDQT